MIGRSKELVEQKYCVANGYPSDAKVNMSQRPFLIGEHPIMSGYLRRHRFRDGSVWSRDGCREYGIGTRSCRNDNISFSSTDKT